MFVKRPPKSTDPSTPRRVPQQARGRERYERILRAAAEELDERGYDEATTASIAERAGVPIGSVYQWFPNKAAILRAIVEGYRDGALQAVDAMLGPEAIAAPLPALVEGLVEGMARFHLGHAGYRTISSAMLSPDAAVVLGEIHVGWLERTEQFVAARVPSMKPKEREIVALAAVHAVDLLKYLPHCESEAERRRLITETQRLLLRYLEPIEREHRTA